MAAIVRGNYLDPITVCRRACSQSPGLATQSSGVDTVSEARLIWLLAICMKLESRGFLGVVFFLISAAGIAVAIVAPVTRCRWVASVSNGL